MTGPTTTAPAVTRATTGGRGPAGVAVIGGGIAGLAAARRLVQLAPDVPVTVFESSDRLGGKVLTERVDGYTVEGGPDSFLSVKPRGVGLCAELGLTDDLQGTIEANRQTFVMRRGRLHPLPEGLTGLIPSRLGPIARSSLLSPLGKARLGLDFVLPARGGDADESLASFVRRRLGTEAYGRLIEPLMAGIYAGDGETLSLAATFPHLRAGERQHGGLIRGVLANKRAAPVGKGGAAPILADAATGVVPTPKPGFLTPTGGTGEIVAALETSLRAAGVQTVTGSGVQDIEAVPGGYRVTLVDGARSAFTAVIVAAPAHAAAGMLAGLDPDLAAPLAAIPHVSSVTVSLGYRTSDLGSGPVGYGYVVPRAEGRPVLACTWTSNKWAHRTPDGHVLLRAFIGRAGQPDPLTHDDDALVAIAREEFRVILGQRAEPTLRRVYRWPLGMPQYTMGHLDRLAAIEARVEGHPGLALCGNGYRGVGLPDCIASGERAAERVLAAVGAEIDALTHTRRGP